MGLAAWGFYTTNVTVLLGCIFLMGLHSTLFGPVKFAYLPQHLNERELTGGNGMVEMGTFVAILLGNVAGGLLIAVRRRLARPRGGGLLRAGAARPRRGAVHARVAGDRSGAAHQLEPRHRDLAQPEAGAWRPRRVPLAAGHQLDVVLRRGVPGQFPASPRRCCTATSRWLRCCWWCSRWASASARCCAKCCRAGTWRSASCRWARSA